METTPKRKIHKGGDVVRTEPYDIQIVDSNPFMKEAFQRVG